MADLYLSRKAGSASPVSGSGAANWFSASTKIGSKISRASIATGRFDENGVEEIEMLLEAYFKQIDETLNKLRTLREYINHTEDYINIQLDNHRNRLIKMDGSSENQSVKSTKRQWTAEEDAVLVQGLLKLVDDGWKADAGSFKPGYTKVLEKYIHNKFPGCTLRANPHIESRVKRLKSQYAAIKDMLGPSASGFGWDDTRKMIIVDKEIYSQWCKSHPNAIGLYGKPFPHFDTLDTVFGKDKASGNVAEDTADMAAEIEKEYFPSTQGGGSGINLIDDEDDFESQIPETPIANTTTPGSNPTNQSQRDSTNYRTGKRGGERVKHNDDGSDSLLTSVNKLGEFYASGVDNMKQLSSCFMHEKITAERRNEIVAILNELELPDDDVVMAAVLITKDNNLCDCFFAMNTSELRKKFVGMLLRTNGFQ